MLRFQLVMLEVNYLLPIGLLLVLGITLFLRKMHRQVPIFFGYVVFETVANIVLYALLHFGNPYAFWYSGWANEGVNILFEFVILTEIFNALFASYDGILQFARLVLTWSIVILAVIGVSTAVLFHAVSYSVPVLTVILLLHRSIGVIQLGLVLTFFGLSKYLHLRWRNLIFGIVLGFGFCALIYLTGDTVRMYHGQAVAGVVSALENAAYWVAVLIWLSYALQPEVTRIPIVSLPSHELERWDRALGQLLGRTTSSPMSATGK